jgi:hypothetical protein
MARITAQLVVIAISVFLALDARAQCGPNWISRIGINGVKGTVKAICFWDPDGPGPLPERLVVGGTSLTVAGDQPVSGVAAWDGTSWHRMGVGVSAVSAFLTTTGGDLLACLENSTGAPNAPRGVARWNGEEWEQFGIRFADNSNVNAVVRLPNDKFVIAGKFVTGDGKNIANIALWNGSEWTALGGNPSDRVRDVAVLSNGEIVAAGLFNRIGTVTTGPVARWDGTAWKPVGSGSAFSSVASLAISDSDEIIVSATDLSAADEDLSRVFKLNQNAWERMGGLVWGPIHTLEFFDNTLYIAGYFSRIGNENFGSIAKWVNGWQSPVAKSSRFPPQIYCLYMEPSGRLVIGGNFAAIFDIGAFSLACLRDGECTNAATGVAGNILCSAATPDGRLVVGGTFTSINGVPLAHIAMWDGFHWSSMGEGFEGTVTHIAVDTQGRILAAGEMLDSSSATSYSTRIRRWDGVSWSWVSSHKFYGFEHLLALRNGNVAISVGSYGGPYLINGRVAIFDGSIWYGLGTQPNSMPEGMAELQNGNMIVAGYFSFPSAKVLNWNGSEWSEVGTGTTSWYTPGSIASLMGDEFAIVNSNPSGGGTVRLWSQSNWKSIGSFGTGYIKTLTPVSGGMFLASGEFSVVGGVQAYSLALWDGSRWIALGTQSTSDFVTSVSVVSEREIVAFGNVAANDWRGIIARRVDSLVPIVGASPKPAIAIRGETLVLRAAATPGFAELSRGLQVAWFRNGDAIANGQGGASDGGGIVAGATEILTHSGPSVLSISNVQPSDRGSYSIRFLNSCGEATSIPVEVKVKAHITDINADGHVDDADFLLFTTQYDLMLCTDPLMPDACSADFNQDGFVDDADFAIFIPAYNALLLN